MMIIESQLTISSLFKNSQNNFVFLNQKVNEMMNKKINKIRLSRLFIYNKNIFYMSSKKSYIKNFS